MTPEKEKQIIEAINKCCELGFGSVEIRIQDNQPIFIRITEDRRI